MLASFIKKKDLEDIAQKSHLRGETKDARCCHYDLYVLLAQASRGTCGLSALAALFTLFHRDCPVPLRDALVLLTPTIVLLAQVGSQTASNNHLQYVSPSFGIILTLFGPVAIFFLRRRGSRCNVTSLHLIGYSVSSAFLVYPHRHTYFNDLVGRSTNGNRHLLGSSMACGYAFQYPTASIDEKQRRSTLAFAISSVTLVVRLLDRPAAPATNTNSFTAGTTTLDLYSVDRYSVREHALSSEAPRPPKRMSRGSHPEASSCASRTHSQ